jgi:hypothetical protein
MHLSFFWKLHKYINVIFTSTCVRLCFPSFINESGCALQVVVHDLEVPVSSFGIVKPILGKWLGKLMAVSDPRKDRAPARV